MCCTGICCLTVVTAWYPLNNAENPIPPSTKDHEISTIKGPEFSTIKNPVPEDLLNPLTRDLEIPLSDDPKTLHTEESDPSVMDLETPLTLGPGVGPKVGKDGVTYRFHI